MQTGLNMQWNSVSEFFHMGGYALYVWSSFGVTLLAMVVEMWLVRRQRIRALMLLKDERSQEGELS